MHVCRSSYFRHCILVVDIRDFSASSEMETSEAYLMMGSFQGYCQS